MTSPDLTNVVWVKTILTNMNVQKSYRHIRPKKVKYPIPEIPDDSEKKSGTDWVLPKIIGSGRVSGTRQALLIDHPRIMSDPSYEIRVAEVGALAATTKYP